jgi:hypothetical protein
MCIDPVHPGRGLDLQFSRDEREVFAASTRMVAGVETSSLFWEDCWLNGSVIPEIAFNFLKLVSRRIRKRRTVNNALAGRHWISDIRGALSLLALWQYIKIRRLVCEMSSNVARSWTPNTPPRVAMTFVP